jgi:Ala-tRNA(Pro) deacylase
MRGLASYVGCAKFEFATEEVLWQKLQVHRGSVSPYAFLNEDGNNIPLLIDSDVWNGNNVKFHPCDNTATVVVSVEDFKRYLAAINKRVVVVDANC